MQTNHLKRAMPIVAAALGRKFGVKVIVGGNAAQTDGQTIWLPNLPPESALREVAWGLLAHEASHLRHTDMAVFREVAAQSPLHQHLLNLLEDIRIELSIRHAYPGTQFTLEKVVDWMLAHGQLQAPESGHHPARILTAFLLLSLRAKILGQTALADPAAHAEQVLRQTFPASLVHRLMGLMSDVRGLSSTAEAADLSARILHLLEEEKAPADPPAPPKEPAESSAKSPSELQTNDASEDLSDAAEASGSQGAGASLLQDVIETTEDDLECDLFKAAQQWLEQQSGRESSSVLLPVGEEAMVDTFTAPELLNRARSESRALSTKLQGLVQASRMDRPYATHQGKTLMAKRLHRAGTGEARLFARQTARTTPNTAVHLVVDLSGSMSRETDTSSLAQVAQDAALALAMALDTIPGVSVAVTAFPGLQGKNDSVSCLIRHGQRPTARAGAFAQNARGGTPFAQALWFAAADLMLRQETRRLMLVMTDGEPDDADAALKMMAHCRQAGIEITGVGIGYDVSWLFARHLTIQSASDLKRTLFGLAERFLM
ncbi:VWA domain-containing protein [Thiocystis violacea]|uniref:VWA domain-containing protein n=1 Tax=Thiocystis violacea TaxID=13725 RepID=UPI001903FA75|nr:VWA domain-containing protein [Thiocystis violacea]MBK1720112.1 VWA domain-containing protein [Thiocystis violacea]